MQAVEKFGPAVGRILLAVIYLISGINKILDWDGTVGYMEFKGMPLIPLFLVGAIVLEVVGSLSVIVGFKARWGALALIVFTIPTTLIFHNYWALEGMDAVNNQIMFMKNLAMIGGFLLIMAHGAGPLSLDVKSGGR